MAFIDQGEFEVMKTLSGRRASRCDKSRFRAKMVVSTINRLQGIVVERLKAERRKKERRRKMAFHYCTLLRLAAFRMAFGHL